MQNLKYIMYCRKSTDTEDRQITSIQDQINELRKVAFSRGIEIIQIFQESKSAKKPGRPIFNEMLSLLHKGKADGILCWRINRLARNPVDGGQIQWMLQQNVLKSILTPNREFLPADNVLMMSVELGMANQFIIDLSKDVKRGMSAKAERGWRPSKAPLGYINIGDKNKNEKNIIVKDKKESVLLRRLFDLILTKHLTIDELQIEAKAIGLKGEQKKDLQTSTIYRVVTNPFYYGRYEWPKNSGNWYNGNHEPIITFSEYQQIQDILAKRSKPKKDSVENIKMEDNIPSLPVIYQGLMTCKSCNGAITASKVNKTQKNGNKHQYIYYHCSKRKDKSCNQKSYPVNQEALEPQVLKFLEEITIVPEVYEWAMNQSKARKDNDQDLKEKVLETHKQNLERSKNKIQNLIDMLADNDITREEYSERRKKCESEANIASETILNIESKEKRQQEILTDTFKLATNLKKKFQKGTPDKKKDIILKLGSNLSLKDKKLAIMLDLKFQAFQKYANGANQEIARIKPLETPMNATQNTPTRGAYATMSG